MLRSLALFLGLTLWSCSTPEGPEPSVSFTVYIVRQTPIDLAEWLATVEANADARVAQGDNAVTNPQTGETITVPNAGGDVEIQLQGSWLRRASWLNGRVAIGAGADFGQSSDELTRITLGLARTLRAEVLDEYGQSY